MPATNMTTNLPNGVTNVVDATASTLGGYVAPDPTRCHTWFSDFDDYDANQWIITETGSGTRAVADADGGILVVTNATSDNDRNFLQWSGVTNASARETFTWEAGKSMWMKARLKLLEVTETDFTVGIYAVDTDPLALPNGLWFSSTDGAATLQFNSAKASTQESVTVATLTDDTYFTCGFWYDAAMGTLTAYYNDNPAGVVASVGATCPTTELAVSFGVQNGQDAVASVLSLDYLLVSKDRLQPSFA